MALHMDRKKVGYFCITMTCMPLIEGEPFMEKLPVIWALILTANTRPKGENICPFISRITGTKHMLMLPTHPVAQNGITILKLPTTSATIPNSRNISNISQSHTMTKIYMAIGNILTKKTK